MTQVDISRRRSSIDPFLRRATHEDAGALRLRQSLSAYDADNAGAAAIHHAHQRNFTARAIAAASSSSSAAAGGPSLSSSSSSSTFSSSSSATLVNPPRPSRRSHRESTSDARHSRRPLPQPPQLQQDSAEAHHQHHRQQQQFMANERAAREREDDFLRARRQAHEDVEAQQQQQQQQALVREQQAAAAALAQQAAAAATPPPTSSQHRVYLINCRSCGTFLTDRGMKAVLLLRPHITLYSTDAMPNCGPLHPPSRLAEPTASHEPTVERTCDCLTQTLGCYGCGNAVGYHIVSPCERCTSSVAKHQRSSNGHRTVLHCAEIAVRERRYVPGEPGVQVAPSYMAWAHSLHQPSASIATAWPRAPLRRNAHPSGYYYDRPYGPADMFEEEDDDDDDEESDEDEDDECEEDDDLIEATDKALRDEQAARTQQHGSSHDYDIASGNGARAGHFAISSSSLRHRALKRGDVVYWSDLTPGGERSAPIDSDDCLDMPNCGR